MIPDTYLHSSIDVARLIIAYANQNRYGINLTKMLKMLYFAYGAHLAVVGTRLTDEHPVAWTYGPVFVRARRAFMDIDLLDVRMDTVPSDIQADQSLANLMQYTFQCCGDKTATALVEWTHQPDSPWSTTIRECKGAEGGIIRDEVIQQYFKREIYGE